MERGQIDPNTGIPDMKIYKTPLTITVNVRWGDGYLETFKADEVRFGRDLLWIRLDNGTNRHIPLREVRWFSINPESHEKLKDVDPYAWPNGR